MSGVPDESQVRHRQYRPGTKRPYPSLFLSVPISSHSKNPNYRYRPVYRREGVVRRRKKKDEDDEEAEEEDRKSEVKARILLEGRQVDEEELEREIEEQRIKDQEEGRDRTRSRSTSNARRSRSRSNSTTAKKKPRSNSTLQAPYSHQGRPSSAPPNSFETMFDGTGSGGASYDDAGYGQQQQFLQPEPTTKRKGRARARTMPSNDAVSAAAAGLDSLYAGGVYDPLQMHQLHPMPGSLVPQEHLYHPTYFVVDGGFDSMGGAPQMALPSPRTTAAMANLYDSSLRDTAGIPEDHTLSMHHAMQGDLNPYAGGLRGGDLSNVTLISPSFSRKFSLGRWEVPSHAPGEPCSSHSRSKWTLTVAHICPTKIPSLNANPWR